MVLPLSFPQQPYRAGDILRCTIISYKSFSQDSDNIGFFTRSCPAKTEAPFGVSFLKLNNIALWHGNIWVKERADSHHSDNKECNKSLESGNIWVLKLLA